MDTPEINLLTISREEAIKVARAVFGMTPTQAEEFVTLARGEEPEDVEPQEITTKAFGSYNEGKHKRIPKGRTGGGQFAPSGGRLTAYAKSNKPKPLSVRGIAGAIVRFQTKHKLIRPLKASERAGHAKTGLSRAQSTKKYKRYMQREQRQEGSAFKAFGNFAEGLHPRYPAGSPKGGQFIKKGAAALKRGVRAYWQKTRKLRQAEAAVGSGILAGSGNYNMGVGVMRAVGGDVTGGLIQGTLGLAQNSLGHTLLYKTGKGHRRNKRLFEVASLATTAGRAFAPGFARGFSQAYNRTRASMNARAHRHYMSTVMGLKPPKTVTLPKSLYRFHEVTMKAKKLPKLGSGKRFAKLEGELSKKGIRNPGALAAAIGRKKYGAKRFAKLSAHGRKEIELKAFSPGQKRYPKGNPRGGQFMPKLGAALQKAGPVLRKVGHGAKLVGLGAAAGAGGYHALAGGATLNLTRLVAGEAAMMGGGVALARSYRGGKKIGRGKKGYFTGSRGERALSSAGFWAGAVGAAALHHRKGIGAAGRGMARGASTRWQNRGIRYGTANTKGPVIDAKRYKFHEYDFKAAKPKIRPKGTFTKLESELAARKGIRNPGALANWILQKKYGKGAGRPKFRHKAVTTTHVEPKPILQIALEMRNKLPKGKKVKKGHKPFPVRRKELIPEVDWPTGQIAAQPLVFKSIDDTYRWVLLSSNGYRDRDGELITTKALERDVALWELEGQPYQPLRWWHVALDDGYQHGLELGQTDLRVVHGHTLIESGTFDDPVIGEAVFKAQDELAASVGFRHSPNEPNADKMFEDVSIFERSLLPEAFSSNVLTDLLVTN